MINFENLKPINTSPIRVDYNHMDEGGGIKLDTQGSLQSIAELRINLTEGQLIWVSDNELEYLAIVVKREGVLIAVTIDSTRTSI